LYGDPQLIVLDEPNSNLDEFGDAALNQAIARLKELGKTVIVISHRGGVVNVADTLMLMHSGQIVAMGPRQAVVDLLNRKAAEAKSAAGPTPEAAAVA
jgi:ATP-binding cassette subfamily C exporter for protease/lipase